MNRHITLGLAVVAGALLGAAAIQTIHAQDKPIAFVIADIGVTNQEGYAKDYIPPITKTILDGGGKFLARGGTTLTLEGEAPRIVLSCFNSRAWIRCKHGLIPQLTRMPNQSAEKMRRSASTPLKASLNKSWRWLAMETAPVGGLPLNLRSLSSAEQPSCESAPRIPSLIAPRNFPSHASRLPPGLFGKRAEGRFAGTLR
jgi:uncharacterized protein (DUF1330 family)